MDKATDAWGDTLEAERVIPHAPAPLSRPEQPTDQEAVPDRDHNQDENAAVRHLTRD
jgi:hypothetical protein